MNYDYVCEKRDITKIDKLNKLTNIDTFWDDVRNLTKRATSDHALGHWQAFAEMRYKELFFEPRQRTALDGKTWWCVWDIGLNHWSTHLGFGKYKTKFDCQYAIYNAPL